ncbi:MAG: type II toxin-antitoxin system VapC family toxin [Candidatus Omnitrophica bacterium]|nr:type II toxin-antitoxin system VapC family toxin [Candidatus Omnitrophota bacterium]MCA9424593.1 type II toxin-antitoxin system VapC family toxin [Candidatus Omnitrophota bacterium]MCA9435149.1 type II toxin-antitoxin system VapC family toxin [Candidatus Omnitrophota bacterium]MCA9440952.1 type II toxin-antitoxin system VapC family toxin [Candidatus Omnitrophota bacterium]MCA9447271.1 type II toxin-antitoxin system VapC family toxin [Candidatus Omnitrophota bacterium]
MPILVDTNVIIDVVTDDPVWSDWSISQLGENAESGLTINPAIYAELSYGFESQAQVDDVVRHFGLFYQETSRLGLFNAARAYRKYKKLAGSKRHVLPDFFIGGHAEAMEIPLLTRDDSRYRTYFPTVQLICPDPGSS